ncbi:TetR/AcrR family transcriptional regulator [Haliea sp. E17]|uniref:TetR/AcrR family transcriptional regulator n=1 Tax=Haliea sp. E17 TaxID=3401576 RepID=UPI003AB0FEB8
MPSNEKRRAPNQLSPDREIEIIEAARSIFVEYGLGNATTELIARRAGISKATLYRRYSDKEALFAEVLIREAKQLQEGLEDFQLAVDDPVASIREAARVMQAHASTARHTEIRRLMLAEASRYPELVLEARNTLTAAFQNRLAPYFSELIKQGKMRKIDPQHAAATFGIVISGGFRHLYNVKLSPAEKKKFFQQDIELFIYGWLIDAKP